MTDTPLTIQSFEPHIGTGFKITTNNHVEVFTLTEVTPGKPSFPGGRDPFSLVFSGSSNDLMLNSQLIAFTHPEMAPLIERRHAAIAAALRSAEA